MQFKDKDIPLPEIAKMLGVNTILEGSYRQSGDKLRVTAQLIDAETDNHLWSENYDRPMQDILMVQSDIARNIATVFKLNLTNQEAARINHKPTDNIRAYSLEKKAVHLLFNTLDFDQAIEVMKEALEIDSGFPDAYAGIAAAYLMKGSWLGTMNIQEAAHMAEPYLKKALELDPENLLAMNVRAHVYYWNEWDFIAADQQFLEVLAIDPGFIHSLNAYTQLLAHMGLYEEALEWALKAKEIDPLTIWTYWNLAWAYMRLEERNKALTIFREGSDLFPGANVIYVYLGDYYRVEREYSKAIDYYKQFLDWREGMGQAPTPWVLARLGIACYHHGEKNKADAIRSQIRYMTEQKGGGSPEFFLAYYYSGIEEKEKAFEWLKKAYLKHNLEMINLKDFVFKVLHDDPRYWDLYEKVGFKAFDEYMASKQEN